MKRYCLALDLKNDPVLIAEYEQYHKKIWPEIEQSLKSGGINDMEIYRVSNRLFMIMEVDDDFSLDNKVNADKANPKAQEWETLMWKYQQALPFAKPGEKWVPMNLIFKL
jgi:L-rhamnose mutarotase